MPLECTQAYFGCAACEDGTIYAVGGHDGHTFLHTAEVYTPSTGTWQPIASLRSARAYLGLEVVGGQLYAIGGHDGDARAGLPKARVKREVLARADGLRRGAERRVVSPATRRCRARTGRPVTHEYT